MSDAGYRVMVLKNGVEVEHLTTQRVHNESSGDVATLTASSVLKLEKGDVLSLRLDCDSQSKRKYIVDKAQMVVEQKRWW